MATVPLSITLIGAGQVGRALSKALRARRIAHRLWPFRRGLPTSARPSDLILICVRDRQIPQVLSALKGARWLAGAVVAHVSGVLEADALAALRPFCHGVGQLHPFVSVRSNGHASAFADAYFLGGGDRAAVSKVRQFVRLLGGRFVSGNAVDRARYHLAAAILANGSVALMAVALRILTQAGIRPGLASKMLVGLEQSVLCNAAALGLGAALTGPVRRGDLDTIQRHLALLRDSDPATEELYRSLVRSQLDLVRELGELDARGLRKMAQLIGS